MVFDYTRDTVPTNIKCVGGPLDNKFIKYDGNNTYVHTCIRESNSKPPIVFDPNPPLAIGEMVELERHVYEFSSYTLTRNNKKRYFFRYTYTGKLG